MFAPFVAFVSVLWWLVCLFVSVFDCLVVLCAGFLRLFVCSFSDFIRLFIGVFPHHFDCRSNVRCVGSTLWLVCSCVCSVSSITFRSFVHAFGFFARP